MDAQLVIVTLLLCFWQILISYCKFFMVDAFITILHKDTHKNGEDIIPKT
jgi:hypothetical protein